MENIIRLKISSMMCNGCVSAVQKALQNISGVVLAEVDLSSAVATISFDKERPSIDALIAAAKNAGFDAIPV